MFNDIIYRDTAGAFEDWIRIMRHLNPYSNHKTELFEDVWNEARAFEEMPHFGNIAQGIILRKIRAWLGNCRPEWTVAYEVNAIASFLNINGEDVIDYWQFVAMFDKAGNEDS